MALVRQFSRSILLKNALLTRIPACVGLRLSSHWNKDWKPGPYPKTAEERAAAAKKYGLLPEDYEPYPDDGFGFGDYPKLPIVSGDARDEFDNWDYRVHRRNFGEPIHAYADGHGQDRVNYNARPRISYHTKFICFLSAMGLWFYFSYLGEKYPYFHAVMPKQYYNDGLPHYSFELDEYEKPLPGGKKRKSK